MPKTFIFKLLRVLVPFSKIRKILWEWIHQLKNIDEFLVGLLSALKYHYPFVIRGKTILIIEPNPYHGEILPGFVKYFQELGYEVDVFMRYENFKERIFCRLPKQMIPKIYIFTRDAMKKILISSLVNDYDFIFFSSLELYELPIFVGKYADFLGVQPQGKYGILGVYHSPTRVYEHNDEKLMEEGRIFSITDAKNWQDKILAISPHYFGQVSVSDRHELTHFVSIGGVQKEVKDYDILFRAIDSLLEQDCENFRVTIIGRGKLEFSHKYNKYVEILGRVDYPKMFEKVESGDFILALLDARCELHKRYLTGVISGSKQLTLGFLKPQIIQTEFADAFGFDQNNSIIYENDRLSEAMKLAINMTKENYKIMQTNLKLTANSVWNKSLSNIDRVINRLTK